MLQSQMDLKIDSSFEIQIATMRMPRVGGRSHLIKETIYAKKRYNYKKIQTIYTVAGNVLSE